MISIHLPIPKRILGVCLVALAACQSTPTPSAGTLVIAGGAVRDAGPVMPRFFSEASAAAKRLGQSNPTVEIVPTASGDPAASLQRNLDSFRSIATQHTPQGLLLDIETPEGAHDPANAQRLRDACAIWFAGGDQGRITRYFRPRLFAPGDEDVDDVSAACDRALRNLLGRGGVLGGSSAGAAIMGRQMIAGGRSESALTHGVSPEGVRIEAGMGFFPYGFVDQHFLARGRLGRLLVAMQHTGERFGFGVEENSALVVTLGTSPMFEAVGFQAVCILDRGANPGPRQEGTWTAELSLLGQGDRWDPLTFLCTAADDRIPFPPAQTPRPVAQTPLEAWESGSIQAALMRLSQQPELPQILDSPGHRLILSSGPNTRYLVREHRGNDLFAQRVQLRIERKTQTEPMPLAPAR